MSNTSNSPAGPTAGGGEGAARAALPDDRLRHARDALAMNGVRLSDQDVAETAGELERAFEIVRPLLDHELPDSLDQAGVFRP